MQQSGARTVTVWQPKDVAAGVSQPWLRLQIWRGGGASTRAQGGGWWDRMTGRWQSSGQDPGPRLLEVWSQPEEPVSGKEFHRIVSYIRQAFEIITGV